MLKKRKKLTSLLIFLFILFMGLISGAAVFASPEDETNLQTEAFFINVTVDKEWIGPEGDSITVQLQADGINVGAPVTIDATDGWTHTWHNLLEGYIMFSPPYWHDIEYTIAEVGVIGDDPYSTEISGSVKGSSGTITVTNTNQRRVRIDVQKVWIGPGEDSAIIDLLADGSYTDGVMVNEASMWSSSFDMPKYNHTTGDEIVYTVGESGLDTDVYSSAITGDQTSGLVVTNTNITKIDIPVTVNMLCDKAESLSVNLLVNGEVVDTLVLDPDNSWSGAFEGLFKYDQTTGEEIPYTLGIGELVGDCNVDITVTGSLLEGFTITATPVTTATVEATLPQTGDVSIIAGIITAVAGTGIVTLTRKRK